jgi:hypothetical protein
MEAFPVVPDAIITDRGPVSRYFLNLGPRIFWDACRYVQELSYGYNSDRDDPMILFKEETGPSVTPRVMRLFVMIENLGGG